MAWSEAQKRLGRLELQKRLNTETAVSCRAAFTKSVLTATGALALASALFWASWNDSSGRGRVEGVFLGFIVLIAMLFAALLAYVRFRDWQYLASKEKDPGAGHVSG